jgi:rhomboid protease GluP
LDSPDRSAPTGDLPGRLLAALVAPPTGEAPGVLVGYQPPLAVVELPGADAGVLLLDVTGASPDEVQGRLRRVIEGYQGGLIFGVVVGGGAELRPVLQAADRELPDPARMTLYHLEEGGRLQRLAGRRSTAVERAARSLGAVTPLAAGDVPALIARGKREREEAVRFAHQLRGRFAWVTTLLLASCVVLYGLSIVWSGGWSLADVMQWHPDAEVLLRMGANSAERVRQGQLWRPLSAAFLHGPALHILLNMMVLQGFGGFLEAVLGWRRYLIVYGAAALVGGLASALVGGARLSVGASGAIWGLMLAGFALARARNALLPARIARQLRQRLTMVLILNVVISFLPGIDFYAHFGGGAVGFALVASGLLAPRRPGAPGDSSRTVRLLALATAAALAGSVALALAQGRPWARRAPAELVERSSGSGRAAVLLEAEPPYGPAVLVDVPLTLKVHVITPTVPWPTKAKVAVLPDTLSMPLSTVAGSSLPPALITHVCPGRALAVSPVTSSNSWHPGWMLKTRSESVPASIV